VTRTTIQPASLHDPRPRYSQGIRTNGGSLLFIAGQTSVDGSGQLVGRGDIVTQVEQVFRNLAAVLEAAGGSFDNVVMTTTYLTDIAYRAAFNEVRLTYYPHEAPVNTLVVVKALANEDFLVEIDGIAVLD
jgi:2-iminobutanoate/2-iminopropanoate deaminase